MIPATRRFNTIGLFAKLGDARLAPALANLLKHLAARNLRILADQQSCARLADSGVELASAATLAQTCDLGIVIGGDGSLLAAAQSLAPAGVPLVGINLGRLGFLVDISPAETQVRIDDILAGQYLEEQRAMLSTELLRQAQDRVELTAFNDVVLRVRNEVRMIEFDTYIDDCFVNTQRADGLVVSTPTGSTAYALSGGGPILHPRLQAIVLVPICPHTLSHRPIVVGADCRIEVVLRPHNRCAATVSCDGQTSHTIKPGERIRIRRHAEDLRLLHPHDYDYYHILRAKLRWSEQP